LRNQSTNPNVSRFTVDHTNVQITKLELAKFESAAVQHLV